MAHRRRLGGRLEAAVGPQVRPADAGGRDPDNGIRGLEDRGCCTFLETHIAGTVKNSASHGGDAGDSAGRSDPELVMQAIHSTRPGGSVGCVGVPHGVELNGEELFFAHVRLHGGPAPVRRFLPKLIEQVWDRKISPGLVFDLTLPLDQVAEGYRAMDERRAIKTLLRP